MSLSKRSFYIITLVVVFLDLFTKTIITIYNIEILDILGFINIIFVKNYGISSGIFNSNEYTIVQQIILSLLTGGVIFYIKVNCQNSIGTSLIIGGALGNLLNRIYSGYVIDFIDLFIKTYHWPAFNLADSFICIGGIVYLLEEYKKNKNLSKNCFK